MLRRCISRPALLAAASLLWLGAAARAEAPDPEQQLIAAISAIRDGNPQQGLKQLRQLTQQQPNFRLAQLVYADVLASRSGQRGITPDSEDPSLQQLVQESRVRSDRAQPPAGVVPGNVLKLAGEYPYLILVDLPHSRLYLYENRQGALRLLRNSYAGQGRNGFGKKATGDLRTPVGVYHVTGWKPGESLPDLYGAGALPLNYPNLWDRFRTKTGYGIWLHGVPRETYVRAPRSSEGCVTMANADLLALKPFAASNNTPVILADKVEWLTPAQLKKESDDFNALLDDWRRKWTTKTTEAYLDFYGNEFTADGMNKKQFAEHKRRVNAEKKFIEVKLEDVSLFRYPGEPMMLAEFTLDYRSDNFSMKVKKEQYWRKNAKGEWKIFREENR